MLTSLRLVTRPESGVERMASNRIRVDLPSPLRPTMPIRSALFKAEGNAIEDGTGCIRDREVLAAEQVCHWELLS
ncbi:hypothetical protein NicSoilC12_10020 [Arthrobacter sp. NicSoilC12]|nr:hypothetical protein NicSoilC12_10020 [Arthrobacter sp. NicSoilC12]